jgi:Heparinase II/III-like protein
MKPVSLYAAPALLLVLLCGLTPVADARQNYVDLSPQRISAIAAQLPARPSGLGPACSDRTAWAAPAVKTRLSEPLQAAEALLTSPFPAWDDDAYLEFSRNGERPKGELMMNARKGWLYPLVMAECVEAKGRFVPAIEKALGELANQPSWTWPAHDNDLRNFKNRNYDVDLLAADTAHDIAQALYLLGERINPAVRQVALDALEKRVFAPVRNTLVTGKANWWLKVTNNWNAVCLGGVVSAALAVLADRDDRAVFAAAGEHYIQRYLSGFDAEGYSEEGPSYWNYGFSHFVHLREALHAATSGGIDLFGSPKTRAIALYGYRIEMMPGNIAAFGDAATTTKIDDVTRAYINEAFDFKQPQALRTLPIVKISGGNTSPLTTAALLLFAKPARAPATAAGPSVSKDLHSYFETARVLVSRPNALGKLAVSIKAGGNSSHSHNDIGSYTLGIGQEQPAGDVGMTKYSAKTFSKDRYTIRAINSWGHPVPVVAGQLQLDATKVKAPVLSTRFSDAADEMAIDMAPAYAVPTLKTLVRTMKHERRNAGVVSIEDRFEYSAPETFETAITTRGQWRQQDHGSLQFWQKDQPVSARLTASAPYDIKAETVTEEGVTFTRIGIALRGPQSKGFVRVEYEPVSR